MWVLGSRNGLERAAVDSFAKLCRYPMLPPIYTQALLQIDFYTST